MTAPRRRGRPRADDPSVLSTDALLDVALVHFADHGFEATSMRAIARELDVSHNLIPQRIGAKDAVWLAAVDRAFERLAEDLVPLLPPADAPTDEATLRALVARFVEANLRRPALLRVIAREAMTPGPRLDHIFDTAIEPVRQFGEGVLDRLAADGATEPASVALLYFLMTHGGGGPAMFPALAARLGAPRPDDDKAIRTHATATADLIFDGLRRR